MFDVTHKKPLICRSGLARKVGFQKLSRVTILLYLQIGTFESLSVWRLGYLFIQDIPGVAIWSACTIY